MDDGLSVMFGFCNKIYFRFGSTVVDDDDAPDASVVTLTRQEVFEGQRSDWCLRLLSGVHQLSGDDVQSGGLQQQVLAWLPQLHHGGY